MGIKTIKISSHDVLEVECDSTDHGDDFRIAWFACGSQSNAVALAQTTGWSSTKWEMVLPRLLRARFRTTMQIDICVPVKVVPPPITGNMG